LLGDDEFELVLRAVIMGRQGSLLDGFNDGRMFVAEDERSPGEHVIDIPVSIDVQQLRADCILKEERCGKSPTEGTTHATSERLLRSLE
jgi:hypothetical protein